MYGGSGAGPGHRGLAQAIDWAAAAASGSLPKTFTSFLCTKNLHFARMHPFGSKLAGPARGWSPELKPYLDPDSILYDPSMIP